MCAYAYACFQTMRQKLCINCVYAYTCITALAYNKHKHISHI